MAERIEAVVEFDYNAQEADELTIKKGDCIIDIQKQPGGWWEGTLVRTGKRGMFPDNFVKVMEHSGAKMDVPLRQVPGRRCRVLFSYEPANDDELELVVGDIIDVITEVEEGWWRGKLNAQIGVFPSNFVTVLEDDPDRKEASHRKTSKSSLDSESSKQANANSMNHDQQPTPRVDQDVPELPPKPMKELCRVMYTYEAVNDDELTIQVGDVITLISRDGQDKGWWKGELHGKIGVFPDNFVQVITTDESSKPARPPTKSNITTNRVKDSLTRHPISQTTTQRKSIELPTKPDEKTSPPGLTKKPLLPPPPLKKPQRSPSGASNNNSPPQPDKTNATESEPSESPTNPSNARIPLTPLTFNLKQNSTDTAKPTVSIKPPEPDSADGGCLSRNSDSFSLTNHDTTTKSEITTVDLKPLDVDLDCIGRSAMLSHPTASRVKAPRRRPPSGVPNKGLTETAVLENGVIDSHVSLMDDKVNKAPWVEELKMNQAKKNSTQGRTRVLIGVGNSSSVLPMEPPKSPSPEPLKISPSTVTLRSQAMTSNSRPQSMFGSRSFGLSTSPSSPDMFVITQKQWTELNDKVHRLESKLEAQQDMYMKVMKDFTNKLNEETEKRLQIQAEIEKIANFVTQV